MNAYIDILQFELNSVKTNLITCYYLQIAGNIERLIAFFKNMKLLPNVLKMPLLNISVSPHIGALKCSKHFHTFLMQDPGNSACVIETSYVNRHCSGEDGNNV